MPRAKKTLIIAYMKLVFTALFWGGTFINGLQRINAGRASLIIAINPVFISLLSVFFLQGKVKLCKSFGGFYICCRSHSGYSRSVLRQCFRLDQQYEFFGKGAQIASGDKVDTLTWWDSWTVFSKPYCGDQDWSLPLITLFFPEACQAMDDICDLIKERLEG